MQTRVEADGSRRTSAVGVVIVASSAARPRAAPPRRGRATTTLLLYPSSSLAAPLGVECRPGVPADLPVAIDKLDQMLATYAGMKLGIVKQQVGQLRALLDEIESRIDRKLDEIDRRRQAGDLVVGVIGAGPARAPGSGGSSG